MKELLIVETRDGADHKDPSRMAQLAADVSRGGIPATFFLTENGVFAARAGHPLGLGEALSAGVRIAADTFALRERGIAEGQLRDGITADGVALIVDALDRGATVMWR